MRSLLLSLTALTLVCSKIIAQDSIKQIPSGYIQYVSNKASGLETKLDKYTAKTLRKMQRYEEHLENKISRKDSNAAQKIFADSKQQYDQLKEKIAVAGNSSRYIPKLDTLITSIKFLEQNPGWIEDAKNIKEKITDAGNKLYELQDQIKKAEDIRKFLKERKQYLSEQLNNIGLAKDLKKINKEVYYYSQQLKEYKDILNDPKKIERKALELISKTKPFKDFMRKNSMLASLFGIPADPNDPANAVSLAGLQTRAQVNSLIQNQIGSGGPNAQQQFTQNLQGAQAQLQQLKNQLSKWSSGNSEDIMPQGFKPNDQKTKSFLQRLELGTNLQSQRGNYFLPITSDLGLSVGYKLNDKSVIGIGASYKMGWGSGWNDIHITHQGVGVRSFVDWKLKGSFWISGGYEQNYRSAFNSIDQLQNYSAWQRSGLIGVSKLLSIKSKVFKKTKIQLLWDFLSYQQVPKSQPIVFRVGYNFK